jgi:hypothetical protein
VTLWRPVVAHNCQMPNLFQTRRVCRYDKCSMSVPSIRVVGVGTPHQDEDLHLWVILAIAVQLATIDYNLRIRNLHLDFRLVWRLTRLYQARSCYMQKTYHHSSEGTAISSSAQGYNIWREVRCCRSRVHGSSLSVVSQIPAYFNHLSRQLTCAAQYTLPIISAQHEYSRLVNPGLSTKWFGKNRFHSPCALAFIRRSCMMAGVSHLVLLVASWAL